MALAHLHPCPSTGCFSARLRRRANHGASASSASTACSLLRAALGLSAECPGLLARSWRPTCSGRHSAGYGVTPCPRPCSTSTSTSTCTCSHEATTYGPPSPFSSWTRRRRATALGALPEAATPKTHDAVPGSSAQHTAADADSSPTASAASPLQQQQQQVQQVEPPGPSTSGTSQEEIARRIAASRARRATRISYNCPACSISAATPLNIARHMERCCPDLMHPDGAAWAQVESLPRGGGGLGSPQHEAVVPLLRSAGQREAQLRRRVLHCVFWSGPVDPETGLPARLEADEAARRLGLPTTRAAALLERAMASVPLASDPDGPLEILYEDEHFLAVNKPVGLHTAPIHRFTGGSVVNRAIAYLNRGRGGRAREGQRVKLLTPHGADVPHGYLPPLLPPREPFTLSGSYSASDAADGCSSGSGSDADAGVGSVSGGGGAAGASGDRVSQQQGRQLEPYVLHRLDMATSGLLLFAKRPEVVAGLHQQFRERSLSKLYLAAAVGCPAGADGRFEVDAPIDRHPTQAVARVVAETGKEASTSFAVLSTNPNADLGPQAGGAPGLLFHERGRLGGHTGGAAAAAAITAGITGTGIGAVRNPASPSPASDGSLHAAAGSGPGCAAGAAAAEPAIPRGASLLVCAPHSGRTHQIRVHLQHVGHPIVGDDIYGVTGPWIPRQALHAASLSFTHPLTGRRLTLAAPLHDDMAACLAGLGLAAPQVAELEAEWREALSRGAGHGAGKAAGQGLQRQRRAQSARQLP